MSFTWGPTSLTAVAREIEHAEQATDPTQRTIHTVCDCVNDFEGAIRTAPNVHRCIQLIERIDACMDVLQQAKAKAFDRANSF